MKTNDLPAGTAAFNFRVMKRESGKGAAKTVTYGVYLCRYRNGTLVDWVKNIAAGLGANFADLTIDLARIHEALVLPVLDFATGAEVEPARSAEQIADILKPIPAVEE